MKNDIIKRINTIGKVSSIITLICRIIAIIGAVACIVGGCICLAAPKDTVKFSGGADVNFSYEVDDKLPVKFFGFGDMESDLRGQSIRFGGISVDITKAEMKDNAGVFEGSVNLDNIDAAHFIRMAAVICFLIAIYLAAITVMLVFAQKLAKAFSVCESPFEANVIKRMKAFAYSLIPLGVISLFSGSSFKYASFASVSGLNLNINFTAIILIIAVFLFVQIFNYGAQLQQESDETV